MEKEHTIEIVLMLTKQVKVSAKGKKEAIEKAKQLYASEQVKLDQDADFADVSFYPIKD